jgi:hypothetical protein
MRVTRFGYAMAVTCLAHSLLPRVVAGQAPGVEVTPDQIREWIAAHHPKVYEDSNLNGVIMVIDARGQYVKSVAAHLAPDETKAADEGFDRLRAFQEDSTLSTCFHSPEKSESRLLCQLDGVVVPWIDILHSLSIRTFDSMKSQAATAKFGEAAKAGAVVVTTNTATFDRLKGLGFDASKIDGTMNLRLRAGIVGPGVTYVTVLYLKAGVGAGH